MPACSPAEAAPGAPPEDVEALTAALARQARLMKEIVAQGRHVRGQWTDSIQGLEKTRRELRDTPDHCRN